MGLTLPLEPIGYIVDPEILTTRVLEVVNFRLVSHKPLSRVTFLERGYPTP